ncbi:hypothetical protein RF11_04543 [Thelohanellus kitauei]|uniref:Uncharacterized protein n=1 Tax=Thelohanellus kitauei TaxID=669202 RepID=A0A0C2N1B6_THEKT|nr:hypothetical protein RF11_04543 [Thelohanellus kitauei]
MRRTITYFNNHKLRDGNGQRIDVQTPEIVIQIVETLLKGRRGANVVSLFAGDESIPEDEIQESKSKSLKKNEGSLDILASRMSQTTRLPLHIWGGETVYRKKQNQEALLPIIRENVARESMIWSDM